MTSKQTSFCFLLNIPPKILNFFNSDVTDRTISFFSDYQTKIELLTKHTSVFALHLTFQTKSVEHFMNLRLVVHSVIDYFSSNNRSQLHGFHAPLRRFRVSFVFKVQNTINKTRQSDNDSPRDRLICQKNIHLQKLPKKPRAGGNSMRRQKIRKISNISKNTKEKRKWGWTFICSCFYFKLYTE